MPEKHRVARLAAIVLFIGVGAGPARGQSDTRPRVTIRGSGNDVSIERIEAAIPEGATSGPTRPRGPMAEAIRMKRAGAVDWEVIAYLEAHSEALPSIIDYRDVKDVRDAGAGKSVIAYLESAAAVEIGPTAQPARSRSGPAIGMPELDSEPELDALDGGYPLIGGIAAGSTPGRSRSQRSFSSIRRFGPPAGRAFVAPLRGAAWVTGGQGPSSRIHLR